MQDKHLSRAFIRGLFDTGGGFHRHNPFSAKVEITSYYEKFREDMAKCLVSLDSNQFTMGQNLHNV